MSQSLVSVIVVSYNTQDKLRRCLSCIEPEHELIVVDNASGDGSAAMVYQEFPNALLIESPENIGFGPANNLGASKATRPLLLFLNSDAYAEPGAIDRLATVFDAVEVMGAGGKLLNLDGSLQLSTAFRLTLWAVFCEQFYLEKLFPSSRVFAPYWNTQLLQELPEPAETEQVMGACLMVRAGTELFDERYFLYCEDTDLCWRLQRRGKIVYLKSAIFTHELGSSSSGNPIQGVVRYNRGKELYFKINENAVASIICRLLNRLGALIRCAFWSFKGIKGGGIEARSRAVGFWLAVFDRPSLRKSLW